MADGAEDDIDGIATLTLEMISLEKAVLLHVADDGFDGISPCQFAFD